MASGEWRRRARRSAYGATTLLSWTFAKTLYPTHRYGLPAFTDLHMLVDVLHHHVLLTP